MKLRKIHFAIDHPEIYPGLPELIISMQSFEQKDIEDSHYHQQEKWKETTISGKQEDTNQQGILWVTDELALGLEKKESGEAVLFFLHEKNKHLDLSAFRYLIEGFEDVTYPYFEKVFQRLHGIPWTILTTERCILRETTVEDLPSFFEIYGEPSITAYMEDLFSYEEEKAYTENYIHSVYEMLEFGIWTVIEKATGKIIGRAGLNVREGYEDIELGFVIGVPFQRKGYAFEVCQAICEYAREELGQTLLQAFVMPGNTASVKLLQKLGFEEQGVVQEGNTTFVQYYRKMESDF